MRGSFRAILGVVSGPFWGAVFGPFWGCFWGHFRGDFSSFLEQLRVYFGGSFRVILWGQFWVFLGTVPGPFGAVLGAISGVLGVVLRAPDPFSSSQRPDSPRGGSSGREEIQTPKHGPKRSQGDQSEDHPPAA